MTDKARAMRFITDMGWQDWDEGVPDALAELVAAVRRETERETVEACLKSIEMCSCACSGYIRAAFPEQPDAKPEPRDIVTCCQCKRRVPMSESLPSHAHPEAEPICRTCFDADAQSRLNAAAMELAEWRRTGLC